MNECAVSFHGEVATYWSGNSIKRQLIEAETHQSCWCCWWAVFGIQSAVSSL